MDKNAQSMSTAPTMSIAPSTSTVQLTDAKVSKTVKKVNEIANQLKDQVAQLEVAQQAKQTQIPAQDTDDQSTDDIMRDIKQTIVKILKMVASESKQDELEVREAIKEDDQEYYVKLRKIHEDKCNYNVPAFWRRNFDYGSR